MNNVNGYAIISLDPKGRVATWNESAQRILGYVPEEIIGRSHALFYSPADVTSGHPARELATAAKEGFYKEKGDRVRKDGSRFPAHVTITALRAPDGAVRGFVKIVRDLRSDA